MGRAVALDPGRSLTTRISSMILSWSEAALTRGRGSNEIIKASDWKESKWIIWSGPLPLGRIFLESDRWEHLLLFKVSRKRGSSAFIGQSKIVSHSSYPESYFFWPIIVSLAAIQLLVGRLLVHLPTLGHLPTKQEEWSHPLFADGQSPTSQGRQGLHLKPSTELSRLLCSVFTRYIGHPHPTKKLLLNPPHTFVDTLPPTTHPWPERTFWFAVDCSPTHLWRLSWRLLPQWKIP